MGVHGLGHEEACEFRGSDGACAPVETRLRGWVKTTRSARDASTHSCKYHVAMENNTIQELQYYGLSGRWRSRARVNVRGFQENSYSARSGEPIAYVRAAFAVLKHIAQVGNASRNGWIGLPHSHSIGEYAGQESCANLDASDSESDSDSVSTQEGA